MINKFSYANFKDELLSSDVVAFDIETSQLPSRLLNFSQKKYYAEKKGVGLSVHAPLLTISFWCPAVPTGCTMRVDEFDEDFIRQLFATTTIIAHNGVFDYRIMGQYIQDFQLPKSVWDTQDIARILYDGRVFKDYRGFSLDDLVERYKIVENLPKLVKDGVRPLYELMAEYLNKQDLLNEDNHVKIHNVVYPWMKSRRGKLDDIHKDVVDAYAILDTAFTYLCYVKQKKQIIPKLEETLPQINELVDYENRFAHARASMGVVGLPVNARYLSECVETWSKQRDEYFKILLDQLIEYIETLPENEQLPYRRSIANGDVNWMSPKWQKIYFIDVLGITPPPRSAASAKCYTDPSKSHPKGQLSFSKKAIEYYELRYGDILTNFRIYKRLVTQINKAYELIANMDKHHRVYSQVSVKAATGRTTSSSPNLQNMAMDARSGLGKYIKDEFTGCFAAPPGRMIIEIDISNAESWMAALWGRDSVFSSALSSADFHSAMAALYFPNLWDATKGGKEGTNKGLRSNSKTVTFGTGYGMGPIKLVSEHHDMASVVAPTQEQLDNWRDDYAFIKFATSDWRELLDADLDLNTEADVQFALRCWNAQKLLNNKDAQFVSTTRAKQDYANFAERYGYVQLWTGRVLHATGYLSWNYLCQGGVGELAKRWTVLTHEMYMRYPELRANVVNFVHDALIIECDIETAELAGKLAVSLLEEVFTGPYSDFLRVTDPPIRFFCDVEHGDNMKKWGKMVHTEYPFDEKLKWEYEPLANIVKLVEDYVSKIDHYERFVNSKFTVYDLEQGGNGQVGLSLDEYKNYLLAHKNDEDKLQELQELDITLKWLQEV